jgi:hypothetical protein
MSAQLNRTSFLPKNVYWILLAVSAAMLATGIVVLTAGFNTATKNKNESGQIAATTSGMVFLVVSIVLMAVIAWLSHVYTEAPFVPPK